jgi:hypothetical protein
MNGAPVDLGRLESEGNKAKAGQLVRRLNIPAKRRDVG